MVLVPRISAVMARETVLLEMRMPGAARVRVVEPTTTWVGRMVTVAPPPGATVGAVSCGSGEDG